MIVVINFVLLCGFILIIDYFCFFFGGLFDIGWLVNKFILIGCVWVVFVVVNIDEVGWFGVFWNWLLLWFVGCWSYLVYLFYWLIVCKVVNVYFGSVFVLLFVVVVVFVILVVVYWWVEWLVMVFCLCIVCLLVVRFVGSEVENVV